MKILSLLTYLLRNFETKQFPDATRPSEDQVAKHVINLLKHCPGDIVSTRKEILVAIRHILNTSEFKKGFYHHIDFLIDEKSIMGPGRHVVQSLRPMAYSTIADLITHVRDSLSMSQLTKIVTTFSQNLYDPELPLPVQGTCVRLLLNVAERLTYNFKV